MNQNTPLSDRIEEATEIGIFTEKPDEIFSSS